MKRYFVHKYQDTEELRGGNHGAKLSDQFFRPRRCFFTVVVSRAGLHDNFGVNGRGRTSCGAILPSRMSLPPFPSNRVISYMAPPPLPNPCTGVRYCSFWQHRICHWRAVATPSSTVLSSCMQISV